MTQERPPDKRAAPVALPLPELIARLQELDALTGVERARLAKGKLSTVIQASVAAAGDEGIWQAKRGGMTYKEIMAAMGYADDGPVARAVTAHNKRRDVRP